MTATPRRYQVFHETVYRYRTPVVTSHNEAHVRPRRLERQALWEARLEILPAPDTVSWRRDYFGNDVVYFDLERPHEELRLIATSTVDLRRVEPPKAEGAPAWEEVAAAVEARSTGDALEASEFVLDSPLVQASPALAAYAVPSFPAGRSVVEGVRDLARRIHTEFTYDERATDVSTAPADVLASRRGVCQDFAHVMIGCLRSVGVPARYVSGYIPAVPAHAESGGAPVRVGADASHAWVAAFCGERGWAEIDPTNDQWVDDEHVVLGWGRDYSDVSPVRGVTVGGGNGEVAVKVQVVAMDTRQARP